MENENVLLSDLKIIILLEWLELGGAERQAILLAGVLQKQHNANVEVWGLARKIPGHIPKNNLIPFCKQLEVHYINIDIPMPSDWIELVSWLPKFKKLLRIANPDVLLPYYNYPNIVAGILWKNVGAKTCIWGQRDEGRNRVPPLFETLAVSNTPWFISNSQEGVDFLKSTLQVKFNNVKQIRNGVFISSSEISRSEWRDQLNVENNQILVTMIANLHQFKDHKTLINAWALVNSHFQGTIKPKLVLAGYPGNTANSLHKQVTSLGLDSSVSFLGHVADIPGLLNASDICVHSSKHEGIPNSILEAMAMQLPVIGTDIPGIREALGAVSEKWLVKPDDSIDLSYKISLLIKNLKLRKKVGKANYHYVNSEFGLERLGHDYVQFIMKAVNSSKAWSAFGSILRVPKLIHIVLLLWQLLKKTHIFIRYILSKTPLLWRLVQ